MEFQALFSMSILTKMTVILCTGWIVHFSLARCNPHWRTMLWRAVVVSMLLVPVATLFLPVLKVNLPGDSVLLNTVILQGTAGLVPTAVPSTTNWLLITWAVVVMILTIRMVLAGIRLKLAAAEVLPVPPAVHGMLKQVAGEMGYKKNVTVKVSSGIKSPMVYGLGDPVLLLPSELPARESAIRGIIAHELAHLKAQDLWWLHVIHLAQVLLWFHPLTWRIGLAHSSACERVCDNVAATCVGDVRSYSSTLARMALNTVSDNKFALGGITMVRKPQIIKRLEALRGKIAALPLNRTQVAAFLFISVLSLGAVSAVELIPNDGLLQAAPAVAAENVWLMAAESMPKMKPMPPRPKMPADIAAAGVDTTLVILLFVDEKGVVETKLTRIQRSSGYPELDKLSLEWAGKIEFHPALNLGEPVKVRMAIPVQWKSR
jgi:beta-lactamase regulating signal transducer with metallopeptidase domain